MTLQYADIDDAVLLTQDQLIARGAFTDLQTDLSDHVAVRELWDKRKKKFTGGYEWTFQAQTDHNHSARSVGLYETDGTQLTDTFVQGKVSPRHINASYIYDQHEPAFQQGSVAVVNLVKSRYIGMIISYFEYLEEVLWGKPTDSADDKTPFGVSYWVLKHATEGFNGANPTGFTAGRAGIDSETYTRWSNWAAQYADITTADLLRKMRRASRRTNFRSPVSHANPDMGAMGNGIYVNDPTVGLLEEKLEQNNMNLGNDLASKDGKTLFKSTPIQYAPFLNYDSTDPVYMLDWKSLGIGVMAGWEKNVSKPMPVANKSKVRRVDLDVTLNMVCTDLRRQAVISKA